MNCVFGQVISKIMLVSADLMRHCTGGEFCIKNVFRVTEETKSVSDTCNIQYKQIQLKQGVG